MRSIDLITMAVRNLWKRKLRTFLTILGVIIGTASIVVMVSIGIGMNESYRKSIEEWGSLNVITVNPPNGSSSSYMGGGVYQVSSTSGSSSSNSNVALDIKAINSFKEIPGVEAATPVVSTWDMMLVANKYVTWASIKGIDPAAMEALGYKASEGRVLEEGDTNVIVAGSYVSEDFSNPKLSGRARWSNTVQVDLLNDKLLLTYDNSYGSKYADKSVKPIKIEAAGILEGSADSYTIFMPIKTLEKYIAEKEKYYKANGWSSDSSNKKAGNYEEAMVKVKNMDDVEEIQQTIKDMGFNASSLTDYLKEMQEQSKMLRLGLAAIGAISLIVAAIGIANTMIMSIYERTREIGVMKVIGASLADIKKLFLTEAAIIGFLGGAVGVVISLGASKAIQYFGASSLIPVWLSFSALAFATFVGVASGYFPARRAMKLSALSAIKTE